MAKQTFTTGQVLTAAQMTDLQATAMGGGAASTKTASYVLVAADAGTTVAMNAAGATTITVNTGLFAAGDTVFIQNIGAGVCTITAGSATVSTAGSLALPQYDAGILYFTSTGVSIFYDYIQAGGASPLTTKGDLYTFSTSDTRLPVGTNGQVLTADSSEPTGLKFATPTTGDITEVQAGTGISITSGTGPIPVITNSIATAIDAKGDLIVGTGADAFSRLAVGTNGQVLTADSGEATGLKFATPSSGGGKVLQVIQGTTTTQVSNNTSTFADTTLTATITPATSGSKILVLVTQNSCFKTADNASNALLIRLVRDSTNIWSSQFLGWTDSALKFESTWSFNYLDSPATTSATTYKTQFRNLNNGTGVIVQESTAQSTIILIEIGA